MTAVGSKESEGAHSDLLDLLEPHHLGQVRCYKKGSVLFWQGDSVDHIFVIKSGVVKESSLSRNGRVSTYGILGTGRLLGADAYLLGTEHQSIAEALKDSSLLVIPPVEFERALSADPVLSVVVMRELARAAHSLSDQMRDLSFLDVQQRLRNTLVRLAKEHGLKTEAGIVINFRITHEEIGALVAANRSTITACLNELKKKGYLWTEGQRLAIIPPEQMEILDSLCASVVDGDDEMAQFWASRAADEAVDPLKALDALTSGMKLVDRRYARGEIELPDVVLAAFAMKETLPLIETEIEKAQKEVSVLGTVVIGTVHGDIHDIGKTIVATLLRARGFRVIDLGVNIPTGQFVEAVRQFEPEILALSALTTATSLEMGKVVRSLCESGLRDGVKVMIGGGAVTRALAESLGVNGYHATARGAVELAWRLCTWE